MRPFARPAVAGPILAALMVLALAGVAPAQVRYDPDAEYVPRSEYDPHAEYVPRAEFALGIGYTRMDVDGGGPLLEGRDGIHFEPVLSIAPFAAIPQLRLGGAVGWSLALDETRGAVISHGGNLVVVTASDVTFMLIEPELRLSWRQPFADDTFFIEPGVAGGAAIGWIDVGDSSDSNPDAADMNSFSEWEANYQWKVFLRAGTHVSNGMAGIEASYMRGGTLDFGNDLRGKPEEFYIGIFGSLQF